MDVSYFQRVKAQTPTRLWINNPTAFEVEAAIEQGAVSCTTNPAFGGSLLKREPETVLQTIAACLSTSDNDDDVVAAVQDRLIRPILDRFLELFNKSDGREGLVSVQGNPEADNSSDEILRAALRTRELAPNAVPKIPATLPGFQAVAALVGAGHPVIVTEVFSLAQLAYGAELYQRHARPSNPPPFIMAPITGIFGDRLRAVAAELGLRIDPSLLDKAGAEFARACSDLVVEKGWPVSLLFGGARVPDDFIGLVGRADSNTINYSTVEEIVALDPPVNRTIERHEPAEVVAELRAAFDDFRRSIDASGLTPDEFEDFGPVQHFRRNFIMGWSAVRAAVAAARRRTPVLAE